MVKWSEPSVPKTGNPLPDLSVFCLVVSDLGATEVRAHSNLGKMYLFFSYFFENLDSPIVCKIATGFSSENQWIWRDSNSQPCQWWGNCSLASRYGLYGTQGRHSVDESEFLSADWTGTVNFQKSISKLL